MHVVGAILIASLGLHLDDVADAPPEWSRDVALAVAKQLESREERIVISEERTRCGGDQSCVRALSARLGVERLVLLDILATVGGFEVAARSVDASGQGFRRAAVTVSKSASPGEVAEALGRELDLVYPKPPTTSSSIAPPLVIGQKEEDTSLSGTTLAAGGCAAIGLVASGLAVYFATQGMWSSDLRQGRVRPPQYEEEIASTRSARDTALVLGGTAVLTLGASVLIATLAD